MTKNQTEKSPVQTIEITNFSGRLTRVLNGEMNSGFAKYASSWGYNPFLKPMNLTWFETPTDITGPITDLIVAAKKFYGYGGGVNFGQVQEFVALLGNGNSTSSNSHAGNLYIMQPAQISPASSVVANVDSVIGKVSVAGTYSYGGSLEIYQHPSVAGITASSLLTAFYIGADAGITVIPISSIGGAQTKVPGNYVGTINAADGCYRPLKIFSGLLRFGNATTVATIGAGGTIVSMYNASIRGINNANSDLLTPLPMNSQIQDIDVSIDGNYLLIATSEVDNEEPSNIGGDSMNAVAGDSVLYGWNGSDPNITTSTLMPSVSLTALQTYLGNNLFFGNDSFGSSVGDGINKLLTMSNMKSPLPGATCTNGNFLTWISPEYIPSTGSRVSSMFYFGGLDQENPPGLYRVMQLGEIGGGTTYQSPMNIVVDNAYTTADYQLDGGATQLGFGKHYFSVFIPGQLSNVIKLYRFTLLPTGAANAQFGTYETQTQIFSKKITIKQIRVYTEPTVPNNEFQIHLIGSDGSVFDYGNLIYTYTAGTDITQAQGSLERIDFNPAVKDTYALGIRINNLGIANMTIKKIEVDWVYSGQ